MKKLLIFMAVVIALVAFGFRALLYYQGLQVTSWFRTPWGNYDVGGKWFSLHQIGWACDVIPENRPLIEITRYWPFKCVAESDHIHVQIL